MTPTGDIVFADISSGTRPPTTCHLRLIDRARRMVSTHPVVGRTLRDCAGVAVGLDGVVYVAEAADAVILAVHPDGHSDVVAGGGRQAPAQGVTAASVALDHPAGLVRTEAGELFVADGSDGLVIGVDLHDGRVAHVFTPGTRPCGGSPEWLAADATGRRIAVSGPGATCVSMIALDSGAVSPVRASQLPSGLGPIAFIDPVHLAVVAHDRVVSLGLGDGDVTDIAGTGESPVSSAEIAALATEQDAQTAPLGNPQAIIVLDPRTLAITEGIDHIVRELDQQ